MFGRRSHQRFSFSSSCEGTLHVFRDVQIEGLDGDRIVAMGRYAGVAGQILTMELADPAGEVLEVCVTDSRPVVVDGAIRHRMHLQLAGAEGDLATNQDRLGQATAMLAVLTHQILVHILNCSSSGCLVEAHAQLESGVVGSLRLMIEGQELVDDLQVVRCQAIPGSSAYQIGAEFLWTAPPTRQSLRRSVSQKSTFPRLENHL
jgi:hypothetical protein